MQPQASKSKINGHTVPTVCLQCNMTNLLCRFWLQLFVTPWTVACQAPLFMEFSRQEYWSRLPFPSPRDLIQGSNPCLWHLCMENRFFYHEAINSIGSLFIHRPVCMIMSKSQSTISRSSMIIKPFTKSSSCFLESPYQFIYILTTLQREYLTTLFIILSG